MNKVSLYTEHTLEVVLDDERILQVRVDGDGDAFLTVGDLTVPGYFNHDSLLVLRALINRALPLARK